MSFLKGYYNLLIKICNFIMLINLFSFILTCVVVGGDML